MLSGGMLRASMRDVFAGVICSVLSTAYCLSYAALIFAGPLKDWLSYGVAVTFLSAAIGATVVALRSSVPFAIAGPDTSTSAVTAALVAAMAHNLIASGNSHLLQPTLIVMGIGTASPDFYSARSASRGGRAIRAQLLADQGSRRGIRREAGADQPHGRLERAFRTARLISPDIIVATELDRALESCEEAVVEAHRAEGGDALSLRAWLTEALGSQELAERLADQCQSLEVEPGDVIARQGEPADAMHFILEGRVGITVDVGGGRSVRVRSLGRHTTIGEMGLIASRPRSATIQAEIASVLYELSGCAYEQIKRDDPALSHALLSYVIEVMAERLSFASRVIGVLQR